eukprot:CAMPEP_0171086826 /NCGR_PEP_ID=MMETSP0766_2-20121228/19782_1 /TAXON_ID=439317 /ORGANISM="Gambierdiscus australes, Strain CAWD 149" /LENGTH=150 /DNA_ID=CAMNT_0011544495 /DNA_START=151 /DNA_END=599 /DNA_ORIENTATION=-
MNLDGYEVAYGEKPNKVRQQTSSEALARILRALPPQPFDSAGFTSAPSGSTPMPFAITTRRSEVDRTCGAAVDDPMFGLEEPLRRMRRHADSPLMRCGLGETAAWGHCQTSIYLEMILRSSNCSHNASTRKGLEERAARWRQEAKKLSPR